MKKMINILLLGVFLLNLSYAENKISELDKLNECDWVCSFFNDILNVQDRNVYYKYSSYYIENPDYEEDLTGNIFPWYEGIWYPDFIAISKNKQSLWIASHNYAIKKISGNQIYVELTEKELKDNFNSDKYLNLNWSLLNTKKKFSFIFEFDGDYVDIYVNDKKHFFATFCKYDISTYNQLKTLIKTNECKPWMIEYPKRANGSIDFVSSK